MTLNELKKVDLFILNDIKFKNLIQDINISEKNLNEEEIIEEFKVIKEEMFETKQINTKTYLLLNKTTKIDYKLVAKFFFELLKNQKEICWNDVAYKIKNIFGNQFIEKNKNGDIVVHSEIKKFIRDNPEINWNKGKKQWEINLQTK